MTEAEYNLKRERILDRLDKIKPIVRAPVSKEFERQVSKWAPVVIAMVIAIIATAISALLLPKPLSIISFLAISTVFVCFFGMVWDFGRDLPRTGGESMATRIMWIGLSCVGVSRWASSGMFETLNQHIQSEPRIKQACVRLASQNEATVLTRYCIVKVFKVAIALTELENAFLVSKKDRAEMKEAIIAMNANGLLDQARAVRQAAQMDKSTAPAPEPGAPPSRI